MNELDYIKYRDQYEKDSFERDKLFREYEARWPKWIKRSSNLIWLGIFVLGCVISVVKGSIHTIGLGAMLGFVFGGGFTIVYEKICRKIVGKKLGIKEVSYKEVTAELAKKQSEEFRKKQEAKQLLEAEEKKNEEN